MKAAAPKTAKILLALAAVWPWGAMRADTLVPREYAVTATGSWETMPRLGNDGVSDLVVFTRCDLLPDGALTKGDVFYQRLFGGAAFGAPVQVTSGVQDNWLADVSGDFIAWTAYDSVNTMSGTIMVYQISTAMLRGIGSAMVIQEPRIHGNKVVWREGGAGAAMVMIYDLGWLGTTRDADILAGPMPPTAYVAIGDRFVVWAEVSSSQYDLVAFDLAAGTKLALTATPLSDEREPSTSGPWIVWQAQDKGVAAARIVARNVDTAEERVIADSGVYNLRPSISGDLVAWESMANGNLDVFLYRLSSDETFQVTSDPANQRLNHVFGQSIAYADERTGTSDIYVSDLTFVSATVSPLSYDFGAIVAFTQASTCVNVTNNEPGQVRVGASLSPGSTPPFSIDLPPPVDPAGYSIAAGETFCVPVVFAPTEVTSDPANPPSTVLTITYEGAWTIATVNLAGRAIPGYGDIQIAPASLSLGDVELGSTATGIVTVSNVSPHWPSPLAASLLGISSPAFSFGCVGPTSCTCASGTCSFVLAPLATADLEVRFTPTEFGSASAALRVTTTDQSNQASMVSLSGRGVYAPTPSEEVAAIVTFIHESVANGSLVGSGPGGSASGRLGALENMIKAAGDLIAQGQYARARQQLLDAYLRVDEMSPPPDFATGSAAAELRVRINALRATIGCS